MIERKEVYEWRDALAAFEQRWDIPRIADLTADGQHLVTDGHGNAPITHALEQEPIDLLRERVKACGGDANLIIRHTDGTVSMLAIRKSDSLARYATIGDLLRDPPGGMRRLGADDGDVRPGRAWTVARCDHPDCGARALSRTLDEDGMYRSLIDEGEWLLLSDDRDDIRCFCPAHLRHDKDENGCDMPVYYDPDADAWPVNGELIPFYEKDVCTHPLPLPECEDMILAVLRRDA